MSHAAAGGNNSDFAYFNSAASVRYSVEYEGSGSHAGAQPWAGQNAQDAIALAWTGMGMMRQQIRPNDRVHDRFAMAEGAINIIPDSSSGEFGLRSATEEDLVKLYSKFTTSSRAPPC